MLDLDPNRQSVAPKDAATIVIVRDGGSGLEVFCVERSKQSRFMGGAIVFPGGKLDARDSDDAWLELSTAPRAPQACTVPFTNDEAHLRALAIAACRETLEEAAMLPTTLPIAHDALMGLRARLLADPDALRSHLRELGAKLDLQALWPLGRWITPIAEPRRYDTRFFVAVAPRGQLGAHDEHETMASFWATPREVLQRSDAREVQLMPPTHRVIQLLDSCTSTEAVLALAASSCLDPICPRLVRHIDARGETMALAFPGDPEHEVAEARIAGPSRYVLRGDRWQAENAPR